MNKSFHSICRWTFNSGKGGFVPGNIRPEWDSKKFNSYEMIKLVKNKISNRLPDNIQLGLELHYDSEIDDNNAKEIADVLVDNDLYLAMITPGAHTHYAYGGICSLDENERKNAENLGLKTLDLAYGTLKKAWHPDATKSPAFVLWNGSYGYDIASIGIKKMYKNLKESIFTLCQYEEKKGGELYICFEPKPNEGHPAMLIPTVASGLLFWCKLKEEYGLNIDKKGINKEFGHSEMIGLDHVYDTVEEIDSDALVHMHINSQGYNDGIILGGPGKYDIDHGARINGMNIAIAGLIIDANYSRWKGHDMQVRAYDNEEQGIDRVVRSILSWEACEKAASELDTNKLLNFLANRETAMAEDLIRSAVTNAYNIFDDMYTT